MVHPVIRRTRCPRNRRRGGLGVRAESPIRQHRCVLGLPVDVMTTEYIALGWPAPGVANDLNSELSVVATEDGTDVTIVPTADTTSGVTAGTATTKTLNRGEALPVQSSTGDLSGSMVTSSKPVSVFGGHKCANVPTIPPWPGLRGGAAPRDGDLG